MAITLSSAMASNLVALTSINDDIATTQDRLASGKKVQSALDDPAVYFKARTLSDRADAYDKVNAGISNALKNVTVANKAIDTMYDNLNGLLTQLKDAAAKAATSANIAQSAGGKAYGGTSTSLVGAGAAADLADGSLFQTGDKFAVGFKRVDGSTVTRYFQASSTAGVGAQTGVGAANAISFNSVADLQQAFANAFGADDIKLNVNATTGALSLSSVLATTSIQVAQTTDAGAAGAGNARLDFTRIFGGAGANATLTLGGTTTLDGTAVVAGTTVATFAGTGTAMSQANLDTRKSAADTYKLTLVQLANIAKDAYMPGYENLLAGKTMKVDLNPDSGDVVQQVQIGNAVDPLTLGFTGFNPTDGSDGTTAANFANDTDLTNAVARVSNAMTSLRRNQNILASHNTMLTTRMDFNKTFQSTMQSAATDLTAADSAEEAAKMAAAQNRQSFATNNLSVTKSAEQSLLQLLR
jgi:flagellin